MSGFVGAVVEGIEVGAAGMAGGDGFAVGLVFVNAVAGAVLVGDAG